MFGLSESDLEYIRRVLGKHEGIKEALIFGSRALDKSKKGSDIDLALKGDVSSIITSISGELNDESPLPYFVDIIDYDHLDHAELKKHIDRVGKVIYVHR